MTQTARVITAACASTLISGALPLNRSAEAWRNDFALSHFADRANFDATVKVGKNAKPAFEVHEREIGKREYRLTLIERKGGGKTAELASIRVGMFGKMLDRPAVQVQEPAPVEQTEEPAEA
jgi:hypothetical protein